jgi:hypothetical protein
MSAGHTPGPWSIRTLDGSLGSIDAASGIQVAQAQEISVTDRNTGHLERISNARLIAAAPELLEACRMAIVELKGREHYGFLRDAILKATGGQA